MRVVRVAAVLFGFSFLAFSTVPTDSGGGVVTPEPSMVVLLTAGLAGIGVAAWRRNRKR